MTESGRFRESQRPPGRPRDGSIDSTVLSAGVLELSKHGVKNFSIARVAQRAGVARATVYLRWPNKEQLILDVLRSTGSSLRSPDTGTLEGDLRILVEDWAGIFNDPVFSSLIAHLQAEGSISSDISSEYRINIAMPANKDVVNILRRARDRGEIGSDVSLTVVARCLVGGLTVQAQLAQGAISKSFERSLVRFLIAGLKA